MNNAIKAIQTRYKGYKFRSRLEARYAVFFDALGVKWQYEVEGYDLSRHLGIQNQSVGMYLPDFWLPEKKTWLEVKGCLPQDHFLYTQEEANLYALVSETLAPLAYVFYDLPSYDSIYSCICWKHGSVDIFRCQGLDLFEPEGHLIDDAIDAAKSARFEFGESGAQ